MELLHADHPGRAVRLAYCLNLHPGETPAAIRAGIETVTLPLAERLAPDRAPGRGFGVGMYVPAAAAAHLVEDDRERAELVRFLGEHALDPFTWNAFPFGRFHEAGLKARVFEPTWADPERLEYTIAVARLAAELAGPPSKGRHLSISTHTGMHSSSRDDRDLAGQAQVTLALGLAGLEEESGWRAVLALEPEPRANCNDTAELASWRAALIERNAEHAGLLDRHLGACLDACHAAVEFEPADLAIERATAAGAPLGKLQFTSALALADPAARERARARLLALDEPVFLHQVTGRPAVGPGLLRAGDLAELARALERDPDPWLACDEWRCHFHVPVDLAALGGEDARDPAALATTRAHADHLLDRLLARPDRWGTAELHVEIETYTWTLPGGPASVPGPRHPDSAAPGPSALVEGLEAEYRHVLARLAARGWNLRRALPQPPENPRDPV